MSTLKTAFHLARTAAFGSALALLATQPAMAEDVKMFKTAPTVEELEKALGAGAAKPKFKTRAIVFGDDSAAPAPAQPAVEPASYQAPAPAAAPQPQPAAQPAAAPVPAPAPQTQAAPQRAAAQQVSEQAVGFPINFDLGSSAIRRDSVPFLEAIAGLMRKDASVQLLIEGHTDASGDYVKNMELSRARAYSVLAYLMSQYGIEPTRLRAIGKGPSEPLDTANAMSAENRRVQFRLLGG